MRVGSLFSGIGGLDLGLEQAGMEIVWQVEVDEWCRRVLERHWPDVARFRDVRDCHGAAACPTTNPELIGRREHEYASPSRAQEEAAIPCADGCLLPVDLICGGFPCQPVSHAGRRAGESDSRWLWPEFYRIIREAQPRWVLVENVPGLRSIDDGRLFGGVLRDLAEAGYDAVWFDLSAADVGAPHLRERVFIVADAAGNLRRASRDDRSQTSDGTGSVAHTEGFAGEVRQAQAQRQGRPTGSGEVADTPRERINGSGNAGPRWGRELADGGWWTVEPDVGRVAHGIPSRVDRLKGLGNAVVPQVAEVIGRWIMETA